MKKIYKILLLAVFSYLFVGCGSVGSDQNVDDSSIQKFPTSASVAEPTLENGEKVEEVVAKNQNATFSPTAQDIKQYQSSPMSVKYVNDLILKDVKLEGIHSLGDTISQTEDCVDGGSYTYSLNGSETGGITMVMDYNNCSQHNGMINGKISVKYSNYDESFASLGLGYKTVDIEYVTDFSMDLYGVKYIVYKGSSTTSNFLEYDPNTAQMKLKMQLNIIMDLNGVKDGQKDSVYYFEIKDNKVSMYQTQGTIYIDNLSSYVTYDTSYDMSKTPFVFSSTIIESGEARYNMADGAKVKIKEEGGDIITYVDADGDGTYELRE